MQNFQSYKLESFAASLIDIEVLYAFPNKIKLKEKKAYLNASERMKVMRGIILRNTMA